MDEAWYYLDKSGQTQGPLSMVELTAASQAGTITAATRLNKAGTSEWVVASSMSWLSKGTQQQQQRRTDDIDFMKLVAGALAGAVVLLLVVVAYLAMREQPHVATVPVPEPKPAAVVNPKPRPKPAPPKTRFRRLQEVETLDGALALTKPHMGDKRGEFSKGAMELVIWAIPNMTWPNVL